MNMPFHHKEIINAAAIIFTLVFVGSLYLEQAKRNQQFKVAIARITAAEAQVHISVSEWNRASTEGRYQLLRGQAGDDTWEKNTGDILAYVGKESHTLILPAAEPSGRLPAPVLFLDGVRTEAP